MRSFLPRREKQDLFREIPVPIRDDFGESVKKGWGKIVDEAPRGICAKGKSFAFRLTTSAVTKSKEGGDYLFGSKIAIVMGPGKRLTLAWTFSATR